MLRDMTEAERNDRTLRREPTSTYPAYSFRELDLNNIRSAWMRVGGGQWCDGVEITTESQEGEYHDIILRVDDIVEVIAWLQGALADIKSRPHYELNM
jgi:hypothetical protein